MSTACEFINNNVIIGYNMFIMKKAEFDKFAKWQFDILFEMEKYIKISGYTRAKRVYGYYAEYLLPIYCLYNKLHIRYSPVVSMVGEKEKRTMKVRVRNVIFKIWFRIVLKHIRWEDKPTLTGWQSIILILILIYKSKYSFMGKGLVKENIGFYRIVNN